MVTEGTVLKVKIIKGDDQPKTEVVDTEIRDDL